MAAVAIMCASVRTCTYVHAVLQYKFISSFHLPPVVGDEKNTKYKTHSKLGEREDSIQGTVNLYNESLATALLPFSLSFS